MNFAPFMQKIKTKIKGIIFDLDGTIIDSLLDLTESVNFALNQMGFSSYSPEELKKFIGNGIKSLIDNTIENIYKKNLISINDIQKINERCLELFLQHYDNQCIKNTILYLGVEEFLLKNKNKYYFAILTNKSKYFTKKIIKHLELENFFSCILTGDEDIYKKPKPEGILQILKEWSIHREEVILIGDHHTDIEAAFNANVKSIFAMYGYGYLNSIRPNYFIKNFYSLTTLLNIIQLD